MLENVKIEVVQGGINIKVDPIGIKGDTGDKGNTGDSAYQEWLTAGNTGTPADFLLAIKGEAFEYEDFTPEQLAAISWDLSQLQSDGSFYKDGNFIKPNISTYQQEWNYAASADFVFDFEPTFILSVFIKRSGAAVIPDWIFNAPTGLTITGELLAGDVIMTSYEHFIIQP